MKKRDYTTNVELTDVQWKVLQPLLPEPARSPGGGQIPASNRACLEGIIWLVRNGARFNDMPPHFPSGSTCSRRLKWWHEQGALESACAQILNMLDHETRLRWEKRFPGGIPSAIKRRRLPAPSEGGENSL